MDKEQIKAISESIPMEQRFSVEQIVSAAIESYKADLLREVGEPVAWRADVATDFGIEDRYSGWETWLINYEPNCPLGSMRNKTGLYTSDQVAAAVLKATKPLEERRCEICGYAEHHREHTSCLRTQLAAAQEANEHWQRATAENENKWIEVNDKLAKAEQLLQVAQGRCDGLEEKLAKAEQRVAEWQPIDTAPKDEVILVSHGNGVWMAKHKAVFLSGYVPDNPWFSVMLNKDHIPAKKRKGYPTHWMPLPKAPANGASS